MPGTFSPPPPVSDLDKHHGTCVTHVPWCMSVSLSSGFLWSRWQRKGYRHSWRMRNPQFYVSGKNPMADINILLMLPSSMQCLQICLPILSNYYLWNRFVEQSKNVIAIFQRYSLDSFQIYMRIHSNVRYELFLTWRIVCVLRFIPYLNSWLWLWNDQRTLASLLLEHIPFRCVFTTSRNLSRSVTGV